MKTALLHMAIALIWLFLSPNRDLARLLIGLLIGYGLLHLFRPLLPKDRYLKSSAAFFRWLGAFIKALLLAQWRVAQIILLPRRFPIHPGFFTLQLDDLSDIEIIILTHSISLTPGTTSVEVDSERGELLIHALEAEDPEASIAAIRRDLLEPLLAFTRP